MKIKDLQPGDKFIWDDELWMCITDCDKRGIVRIDTQVINSFVMWIDDRDQGEILKDEYKETEVEQYR